MTGLKPDKVKLVAEESQDDLVLKPLRRDNPHYQESVSDEDFFELATKGQRGFWQPTRVDTNGTAWGCMGTNLSEDKFFQDIIETEIKMHFSHFYASNEYDFDKVCSSALCHLRQPLPHTTEALLARTMPHALEEGDILSTILCLDPRETSDRMLAYIRGLGQGNPKSYLEQYDWEAAKKTMNKHFESLDKKVRDRVSYLRDEASKEYAHLEDILNEHLNKLDAYSKAKSELISKTFNKLKSKAKKILDDIENVKVNNDEGLVSTESREVTSVVNAIPEVSVALPAPEKIAGVIQDKIPIYPVRYGYANVFEDPMPAQAPPTMIEMSQASSLKETGGYILRLLCEGWIYIKEEGDSGKRACHIFKYLQTETPNGVLERFEKYNFTNGKNAQDGLTLDTSSGSDFYPFAFVNAQTQEISIAYSAHEWAETIIDKMNEDEEFRQKAMQRVDLTSSQTDFSVEATEENLGSMVEDYRPTDNKWFKGEKSSKPTDMGLELFTTQDSYPLSPEGIVETMQKSHSEKKNGVLVALYDPVGRQADITFLLTMIFTIEKSYEASRVYPKTIGDIILHLQKSGMGGPLEQSINKYVNLSELNKFYKENKTFAKELSDRRKEIFKTVFSILLHEGWRRGVSGWLAWFFKCLF